MMLTFDLLLYNVYRLQHSHMLHTSSKFEVYIAFYFAVMAHFLSMHYVAL